MSPEAKLVGSTAPHLELPAAAAEVLRRALHAAREERPVDAAFRAAMRRLTVQARQRGLHAEQLVIVLKQEWAALREVQELPAGGPRSEALGHVVSLCIEEYYAATPSDPAS